MGQDQLRSSIERVTKQHAEWDRGFVWGLLNEVDTQLKSSRTLREKMLQREKAEQYRTTPPKLDEGEDASPFSDSNVQMSWGCYVALGVLRPEAANNVLDDLDTWLCEVCAESVAEDDLLLKKRQAASVLADDREEDLVLHLVLHRVALLLVQLVSHAAVL